jgi:betaine-homocysteine S-methyltransferase
MSAKGVLQRLDAGEVLIGDGGFVFAMEKRGYVKAGPWTPEACVENPEAVRQLHREFLRAGSDIMQAFTFYASDDKLENRGNTACTTHGGANINRAACNLAREVAKEGNALFLGGVSQTPTYLSGIGKEATKDIFRKQMNVFKEEKVDLILCEYFEHVEEAEWAVEAALEYGLPVGVTLCIGPEGDMHGVPTGECAVRLVKAGAQIVGINCHFDPYVCLDAMQLMIDAVKAAGLKVHFMSQPLGYMTPDAGRQGFIDLPEFPFALEPRVCTRFDMHRYARRAYDMGIRVIGGCCGFEPYHIRAIAEELAEERGKWPEGSKKHEVWGGGLRMHTKPWVRARARKDYWDNLEPASGRPKSSALSKPDNWGMTAGSALLKQHAEETTVEELTAVFDHKSKIGSN